MGNEITEITSYDSRRDIAIPGNKEATIQFCIDHWIQCAHEAIEKRGAFYVALSGGSTPKAIYRALAQNKERIDWSKVHLFWSDERTVSPNDAESNYKMAMDNGFNTIAPPVNQIYRMKGELPPEESAREYNETILSTVPDATFDLIMLGMGDDGHTASLFPETHGLHTNKREAIANYIPKLETWRLSLTFECINRARTTAVYVLGKEKAQTVKEVLEGQLTPDKLPSQRLGTETNHALWILDQAAANIL